VSEHQLLIRHAHAWAASKNRPLTPDLLEAALDLRAVHDDLPATSWPAGTVEHLMLRRWPAHGTEAPDAEALAATLDTFVHFLRATGRMASGSADPKALAKEAYRSAPKMAAADADVGAHSSTKVLLNFGHEIGISLDDAASSRELEERLERIQDAWNALPQEERVRRMPLTSSAPSAKSLQVAFNDDGDVRQLARRGDPVVAADQARSSAFVKDLLALVEWVAPSKQVTDIGVLRLAAAREAFEHFELWRWQERLRDAGRAVGDEELAYPPADPREFTWRSAADVPPLERLWWAAEAASLLDIRATVVKPIALRPTTNDEWVMLACFAAAGLWEVAPRFMIPTAPALAILGLGMVGDGFVSMSEVMAHWVEHPDNWWREHGVAVFSDERIASREKGDVERSVFFFEDTGAWVRSKQGFRLTDLGREIGNFIFGLIDRGELDA
jgi:hypothetical protein